jgi:mevalonate kinase
MISWSAFHTRVSGKWVLAGEHTVLRGGNAVALPHPEFELEARFTPASSGGLIISPSSAAQVIQEILIPVSPKPVGKFELQSSIPMGAGLGSSAALCVAMTRLLSEPLDIAPELQFQFAKTLEHRFHGRSSGMDIAAILAEEPIGFSMATGPQPLGVKILPKFTFHDTGLRAQTRDCVLKVESFRANDVELSFKIEELMEKAAKDCKAGLVAFNAGQADACQLIAQGMRQAHEAFGHWQLVPAEAQELIENLLKKGALAAKLTGAGGGGFVVALWD